eukprot:5861333-Pyramimonas_sp.AAC.1
MEGPSVVGEGGVGIRWRVDPLPSPTPGAPDATPDQGLWGHLFYRRLEPTSPRARVVSKLVGHSHGF